MNSKSWTVSKSLLSAVEMAEGENDELSIDAFDMMLFMVDCGTDSPHRLLEDFEPPQDLSGNSISPPILTVPSLDSDELVSSLPHIPNVARCELLPQTLECKDDFWVTNPASPQEDLSPELAKSSHVSPLIIRDLEEEDNPNYAASKRSYSHNTSQYDDELQYSLHKRMKRAVSPTRNQEKRRIWGVSSTYAAKKPSMDVEPDINPPRVLTSTSDAGSKRRTSMSIPSSQVVCLDLDNSDAMEDGSGRSNKKTMSRNLVSERHRRHKLNEKLYSLRALVPNISKMDKASIVADAVSYVRDLKRQEKVMQREVSHLAAARDALASGLLFNSKVCFPSKFDSTHDRPTPQHRRHQVVKFIMTHLEDRIYELQICCKRSIGLWLQLTQAIEALGYDTISANFSHINDHIFNNLIIEVQKEQVLSQEELCDKTMKAMLRFGFIFDIQKIKLEDIM